MTERFNYVIARPWDKDSDQLCCYMSYNNQVYWGTMKDAQGSLDYVINRMKEDGEPNDYRIYKVVPL